MHRWADEAGLEMKNRVHSGEIFEYLLGRLAPDRVEEIEQRILTDDDFHQEVEASENELLDQYVHQELDSEARRLFQNNFLTSDLRRRKLQFALALKKKIEAKAPSPTHRVVSLYPYALAASILVVAGLGIVNLHLAGQLGQERARVSALNQQIKTAHQEGGSTQQGWSAQDAIVVAQLAPASSRGGELAEIVVPAGVRGVQFVLQVPAAFQGKTTVQLLNDAGQVITTIPDLGPQVIGNKNVLVATIPAQYLPNANYFLQVAGKQPYATTIRYSLKVSTH